MISLHSWMHSSQMYTAGPAISLRTSDWFLPQKEQNRLSLSSFFFAILFLRFIQAVEVLTVGDDVIDDPVVFGLLGAHEIVPVRVALNGVHRLAGVSHQDLVQGVL